MTPDSGVVAVALDDVLTDPAAARLFADLAEAVAPVALADQVRAAMAEMDAAMAAAVERGPFIGAGVVAPSAVPSWVRLALLETFARWVGGGGSTCQHSPHPGRPEPKASAAWKPGLVVCGRCEHLLRLPRRSEADRRCDGCGRVVAGVDDGDPIWPAAVRFVDLLYLFGCCRDCRYWTDGGGE